MTLRTNMKNISSDVMYMCLCPVCLGQFFDTHDYIISRDRHVQSKDCCDFCNHRYGYDYIIRSKGAGQKQMREASEQ